MKKRAMKNFVVSAMLLVALCGCGADEAATDTTLNADSYEEVKEDEAKSPSELSEDEIAKNQEKYREELYTKEGERITTYLPSLDETEEPTEYLYTVYDFDGNGKLVGMKHVYFYSNYQDYKEVLEIGERFDEKPSFQDDAACYYEMAVDSSDTVYTQYEQYYGYDGLETAEMPYIIYNPVHEYVYTENAIVKEGEIPDEVWSIQDVMMQAQEDYRNQVIMSEYTKECEIVGMYKEQIIYETTYYDANGVVVANGRAYCGIGNIGYENILENCKMNGVPIMIRDDGALYLETYVTEGYAGLISYQG